MPCNRNAAWLRSLSALAMAVAPLALAEPAEAATTVKSIVFPAEGSVTYTDTFGAPRSGGRTHEGIDLMGKKMQPLLSAVEGTVLRVRFDNTSSGGNSVTLRDADGWTYHYIHVNNDTPGTDDGKATRAQAFPPAIVDGATVKRGQVVAYMGDSGNAESTSPHLHFEIREPAAPGTWLGSGTAINPYPSLQQALVWVARPRWELRRTQSATTVQDQFSYGLQSGDRALLCDWDGDGLDEPVIVRGTEWHLRSGLPSGTTARRIAFGTGSEAVLCGDLDGRAGDEPVLFSRGTWTVGSGFGGDASVAWTARYGIYAGDAPVLGDWDRDGDDDLGIHRDGGTWYLRSTGTRFGSTLRSFTYGLRAADLPVAGDWDGDGDVDAAIFRDGVLHLRSSSEARGATVRQVRLGAPADQPVAGRWTTQVASGLGVYRPAST